MRDCWEMWANDSSSVRSPGSKRSSSNLADAIAYNNHDVDDGVRAGLITVDELLDVRVFSRFHAIVVARYPESPPRRVLYETIRRMVDYLVSDVITQSQKNIVESSVDSIQAVRAHSQPLISLSEDVLSEHQELKRFLRTKLYNHPKVREVMDEAGATLKGLFEAYMKEPRACHPNIRVCSSARKLAVGGRLRRESWRTMWRG